ncbi:hypothetical protein AWENTII_007301 [Aspergillus wentii]
MNAFGNSFSSDICGDIKEKKCFVALDAENELQCIRKHIYELRDGRIIEIGAEAFQAPEILFEPITVGIESVGIHQQTDESILRSEISIRRDLSASIVLSGGTSILPGMADQLLLDLVALSPPHKVKVRAPPDRKD